MIRLHLCRSTLGLSMLMAMASGCYNQVSDVPMTPVKAATRDVATSSVQATSLHAAEDRYFEDVRRWQLEKAAWDESEREMIASFHAEKKQGGAVAPTNRRFPRPFPKPFPKRASTTPPANRESTSVRTRMDELYVPMPNIIQPSHLGMTDKEWRDFVHACVEESHHAEERRKQQRK